MKITNLQLFLFLVLFFIANMLLFQNLLTDNLYYQTYSGQISEVMIAKMLKIKHQYSWVGWVFGFVIIALQMFFTSCCFWIGSLLNESNIKFKDFWRVVLISEFVFIGFAFFKTGMLYKYEIKTLNEINQFQPFTLYSIFETQNIPAYFQYPLTLISIPETIYWIVLAILFKPLIFGSFWSRIGFVAKTFGLGLLIWVSFIVFVNINMSS